MSEGPSGDERNMTILLVIVSLGLGGAERQLVTLATEMDRRGHQVSIVALAGPNPLASQLASTRVELIELGGTIGRSDPRLIVRLRRLIQHHRPDIIHSHIAEANIVTRLASLATGVPMVDTAHNVVEGGVSVSLAYRATRRWSSVTTFVGRAALDRYVSLGLVRSERALCIPNAVDPRFFSHQGNRHSPPDQPHARTSPELPNCRFLFVGRLVAPKRVGDLIQAFGIASQSRPNLHLTIVGDGPERSVLEAQAEAWSRSIEFRGVLDDVTGVLVEADAFVTASGLEGQPISILEAAAMGLPVASTEFVALADTVDLPPSLRCPVGDVEALAEVLLHVAQLGPEGRRAVGAKLRAQVESGASVVSITDRWLDLYRSVLTTGSGR